MLKQSKKSYNRNKLPIYTLNIRTSTCIAVNASVYKTKLSQIIIKTIIEIALLNSVFKCYHSVTTNTTNRKRIPWVD